jgi:hypothetical protein
MNIDPTTAKGQKLATRLRVPRSSPLGSCFAHWNSTSQSGSAPIPSAGYRSRHATDQIAPNRHQVIAPTSA